MNYVAYVFLIAIKLYTGFFFNDNGKPLIVKHLFTLDLCRVKVYSYSLLPCRYKYINKSIKYITVKKMVSCIDEKKIQNSSRPIYFHSEGLVCLQ